MNTEYELRSKRRGFTLIELIVAVAIVAVLVGAAVPVTSKVLSYKARMATRQELQVLADAAVEHFRDTRQLPAVVGDLIVDAGVSGWSGPYLPGVVADHVTGASGYERDAWSRSYVVSAAGDVVTIRSVGEDSLTGTGDDLSIQSDVTFVRREETLSELRILNQTVAQYNAVNQSSSPLSTTWSSAFNTLVAQGLLPNDSNYLTDGWGQPYEPTVLGGPLVELASPSLKSAASAGGQGGGSGAGGNSNAGNGNQGNKGKKGNKGNSGKKGNKGNKGGGKK